MSCKGIPVGLCRVRREIRSRFCPERHLRKARGESGLQTLEIGPDCVSGDSEKAVLEKVQVPRKAYELQDCCGIRIGFQRKGRKAVHTR